MRKVVGLDRIAEPAPGGPKRNLIGTRPRPFKPPEKPNRQTKQKKNTPKGAHN